MTDRKPQRPSKATEMDTLMPQSPPDAGSDEGTQPDQGGLSSTADRATSTTRQAIADPGTAPPPGDNSPQLNSRPPTDDASTATSPQSRPWQAEELEQLIETYERSLLAYAGKMLSGDWQAAQDAVQETFLRLCKQDPDKVLHRVRPWLFAVCRSRIIDMHRTEHSHAQDMQEVPVVDPRPDAATQIADDEQRQAETSRLTSLVQDLSKRQQEVLRLRIQAGLSYREIAEVTGLSVSNVGFHLHAAIRSLKAACTAM